MPPSRLYTSRNPGRRAPRPRAGCGRRGGTCTTMVRSSARRSSSRSAASSAARPRSGDARAPSACARRSGRFVAPRQARSELRRADALHARRLVRVVDLEGRAVGRLTKSMLMSVGARALARVIAMRDAGTSTTRSRGSGTPTARSCSKRASRRGARTRSALRARPAAPRAAASLSVICGARCFGQRAELLLELPDS